MPNESGYNNQKKFGRPEHKTHHNVGSSKFADNVISKGLVSRSTPIAIDSVSRQDTDKAKILNLEITAHGALRIGEVLKFATGALIGVELDIIGIVDADNVLVYDVMEVLPQAGDEVIVAYYVTPQLDDEGNLIVSTSSGPVRFIEDGIDVQVEIDNSTPAVNKPLPSGMYIEIDGSSYPVGKDTAVPANTVSVPVEITGASGPINITAGDIDIHTSSEGVNFDSMRIGDGGGVYAGINGDGSLKVSDAPLQVLTGAVTETAPASDTASSGLNGRLQRIAQRITSLIALLPASIGQKANATSLAVSLSTEQETILTGISGKLPATLGQKASTASLSTVLSTEQEALIGALTETAPASDTDSSGLNGRLQRIAQRITSLIALMPTSLGQKTMANSFAVTLASDQSSIPVTTATTDVTTSGNITTQNLVPAGVATANSAVEMTGMNGVGTITFQVTGTYTGALSVQGTVNGSAWITLNSVYNLNNGAISASTGSGVKGIFQVEASGFSAVRVTGLAAMTGTAAISIRSTRTLANVNLQAPIPAGANIIGALTANQSTNVAQINGVAPLMGNGVTGTGSLRVTIASDTTANTNPYLVSMRKAAVTVKQAAITVGLTAVRLTTDAAVPSATRQKLSFMVDKDSVANFWYGSSSVTATSTTRGIPVFPGQTILLEDDANDYYLISDVAAQTVYVVECE